MSKCSITAFLVGITITVSAFGFFGQMMQMPSKAMMMGSTMMQGQDKPCDCNCSLTK